MAISSLKTGVISPNSLLAGNTASLNIDYLLIAGGGAGNVNGGGAGAGGYLTSTFTFGFNSIFSESLSK